MEYLELYRKVKQLAKDKGLDKVDPHVQYIKMTKEQGKLVNALLHFDMNVKPNVQDSLGSCQVQLIVYCLIRGIDLTERIKQENKYGSKYYKSRVELLEMGKLHYTDSFACVSYYSSKIISAYDNENSVEEYRAIGYTLRFLNIVATEHRVNPEETLEMAYNKMKDSKD